MSVTGFIPFRTLAVIGLGLIGGSFIKDIRRLGLAERIIGYENNPEYRKFILTHNFVDYLGDSPDDKLREAELILLAVPVRAFKEIISKIIPYISKSVIITDVGSVKYPLIDLMTRPDYKNIRFVGGHPITGSEYFGPSSAKEKLFDGKRLILTPCFDSDSNVVERVYSMWTSIGAIVSEMEPQYHDELFASVSHLPHLLAYASIQAISNSESPDVLKHSGAGLKDFSRIASSSPDMWSDIFIENKRNLITRISIFKDILKELEESILKKDKEKLMNILEQAKKEKDRWMT